jgi:hypothetical protein
MGVKLSQQARAAVDVCKFITSAHSYQLMSQSPQIYDIARILLSSLLSLYTAIVTSRTTIVTLNYALYVSLKAHLWDRYDSQNQQRLLPYTSLTGLCNGDAKCLLSGMNIISKYYLNKFRLQLMLTMKQNTDSLYMMR